MSDGDHSSGGGLAKLFDLTLVGTAASVDTGACIPPGFSALEMLLYFRGDAATASFQVTVNFNGDTGNNYDERWMRNTGDSANASSSLATSGINVGYGPAATGLANSFASGWCIIPAYDNTVGFKSGVATFGDAPSSGGQQAWTEAFVWRSTAAINRIKWSASTGNFIAGSRFIVYGRP